LTGLLLALFLAQISPQTGAVTGLVRGANGMPAAGVRVYAITVRDAAEPANAGTALESQAQTNTAGRYRLEVPAGRYYIASGSVDAPTYYPGTTNRADARVLSIAAGGLVENIDFSSFVLPVRSAGGAMGGLVAAAPPPLPPGSTGVLEGVIRYPEGAPAPGMLVVAVPSAIVTLPTTATGLPLLPILNINTVLTSVGVSTGNLSAVRRRVVSGYNIIEGRTDASGRYRLENMPPETYYIATGFADAAIFFPGTSDIRSAGTFTTTPATNLNTVDFTIPRQPAGVSVRGRVTALGGTAAAGANVELLVRTPLAFSLSSFGLPTRNLNRRVTVNADGTFEAPQMLPADYSVIASDSGVRTNTLDITVGDQPVSGLELVIPLAALSGRILLEDGSPLPNAQLFGDAIVSTVSSPNLVAFTIMPLSSDGKFGRILEADEYRFYLRNLPDEYTITSITSGTQDLLKETLKATVTESRTIEVRVARRPGPAPNEVKVSGSVVDGITGLPAQAERVNLCCLATGPVERFSTPLRSDGSFEFAGVPPGRYTMDLQTRSGLPKLLVVDSRDSKIEVANEPLSGLTVLSTPQFGLLVATIVLENGISLPANTSLSVVFTSSTGRVRVAARRNADTYMASVPGGELYNISVTNLPEGYSVKPSGSVIVPAAPAALGFSGTPVSPPPTNITITITRSAPR
jgi:hypothetical protein